jgi:hypothetical protein
MGTSNSGHTSVARCDQGGVAVIGLRNPEIRCDSFRGGWRGRAVGGSGKRRLKAGEIAFIPKGVVHAIHNPSKKPMSFLAILSSAQAKGPFLVDVYNDEPWRSLRKPFE